MVSKVDSVVGRIVSDLQRFTYILEGEERSVFNDTIIIFSSDNGAMSQVYGCFFVNVSYIDSADRRVITILRRPDSVCLCGPHGYSGGCRERNGGRGLPEEGTKVCIHTNGKTFTYPKH
jgi:hypothetical protein